MTVWRYDDDSDDADNVDDDDDSENKFSSSFASETLVVHIVVWELIVLKFISSHIKMGLFISLFCEHFILYVTSLNATDSENCYQHYFWKLTRRKQTYN